MNPAGKYIACVWQYSNGWRVTRKRAFKTDWGAIRFAEATSQKADVEEVSVTLPHDEVGAWGPQLGIARDGEFIISNKEHTMSKKKDNVDTGEDATPTKSKGARKTRAKRERVTSPVEWVDLLDMADLAIKSVDMKHRPELPKGVEFADNFCDAYARFLSGGRRTHPGSQARPHTNDELHERREYVRKSIAAVVAGKKQPKAQFEAIIKSKREKAPKKAKATTKPKAAESAKKSTRKQQTPKQVRKSQDKKAATTKSAVKQAKSAAAKKSSRSKVVKTKKRGR